MMKTKAARKLRKCPSCGRKPMKALVVSDGVKIACPTGCRIVVGVTLKDARAIWDQPRFTDKE